MKDNFLVGRKLPSFNLKTTKRDSLTDSKLIGNRNIIFIYPKNDTSSCTKENLTFSENVKEFEKLKINVFGLSKDSIESHLKFTNKYKLEVELISDPDIHLITQLGSWVKKSMYGKEYMGVERSTFLIDQNNKIVEIWRKVKVSGDVEKVLNSCKNLIN